MHRVILGIPFYIIIGIFDIVALYISYVITRAVKLHTIATLLIGWGIIILGIIFSYIALFTNNPFNTAGISNLIAAFGIIVVYFSIFAYFTRLLFIYLAKNYGFGMQLLQQETKKF